jgi:hypothetical protein
MVVKTINGIGIVTQALPATLSAPCQIAPHAQRDVVSAAHVHTLNVHWQWVKSSKLAGMFGEFATHQNAFENQAQVASQDYKISALQLVREFWIKIFALLSFGLLHSDSSRKLIMPEMWHTLNTYYSSFGVQWLGKLLHVWGEWLAVPLVFGLNG